MHSVTFILKRAHLSTLKILRPVAARHDLTPARVDVLCTLLKTSYAPRFVPFQFGIAERLGLSRSTVCKMIKVLIKGGFVQRTTEWNLGDQRFKELELTRYGRRCLLRVLKALRRRDVDKPLCRALPTLWYPTRENRTKFFFDLFHLARRLILGLHDPADIQLYPLALPALLRPSRLARSSRHALR